MKAISIFNNKGGVGKTTLTFHLAHALAEMGHRTLLIDFDPQCNLTILGMDEEALHEIWRGEDAFIDDFQAARDRLPPKQFEELVSTPRSIHFLLKPSEDGAADIGSLAPPVPVATNLDLIPGRLTMHLYEDKIASRWSDVYQGNTQRLDKIFVESSIAVSNDGWNATEVLTQHYFAGGKNRGRDVIQRLFRCQHSRIGLIRKKTILEFLNSHGRDESTVRRHLLIISYDEHFLASQNCGQSPKV